MLGPFLCPSSIVPVAEWGFEFVACANSESALQQHDVSIPHCAVGADLLWIGEVD